ncbi:hypothetical protein [Pseudoalteromonas phage PH357]|nr:hypothetical protein [Pseudoalteromonas phage PH357]
MKISILEEDDLHLTTTDVLGTLKSLEGLEVYVSSRWFLALIQHPQVLDLWNNYMSVKHCEEHPQSKKIICKGKFKFLGINWKVEESKDE